MRNEDIFFTFSPELHQLLDEQGVDIVSELRSQGLDIQRQIVPAKDGSRDAALILLASSVTVASTGWAIAKVLDAVTRGKRLVVRQVSGEAPTDSSPDGTPAFPVEAFQDKSRITASLDFNSGLRFELKSGGE